MNLSGNLGLAVSHGDHAKHLNLAISKLGKRCDFMMNRGDDGITFRIKRQLDRRSTDVMNAQRQQLTSRGNRALDNGSQRHTREAFN